MRSYDSLPDTPFRCKIVQRGRNPLQNSEYRWHIIHMQLVVEQEFNNGKYVMILLVDAQEEIWRIHFCRFVAFAFSCRDTPCLTRLVSATRVATIAGRVFHFLARALGSFRAANFLDISSLVFECEFHGS
ncbi:hypothetical protein AVEN_55334-1 [Araneus ventricosus]|uniref:Uncharacterized protein n=1 Tax=Araneus ventricosus TaxID=182803 RepID=A0A4Y2DDN4_ARAVE|nr:hypothetical protein AVEN_55334-1 [Araneus ventricosus]